ncbi:MAG: hypothetical protein IKO42_05710 [Opitutales bacterium]|nr:hypothetical protein [Opitutales bacterium]
MKSIKKLLFLFLAVCASCAYADVKCAYIFSDNMVLQMGMPIRVWGIAAPGEKVSVKFMDLKGSAKADKTGHWRVDLPAKKKYVKEGQELVVQGKNKIVFKDVLVGEVWLGSGQSNMQFQIKHLKDLDNKMKTEELPSEIRYFWVPAIGSETPLGMFDLPPESAWKKYTPENYDTTREMSILLTLFAQRMHRELDVPIGVINSSYGGANLETWMSKEAIAEAGTEKEAEALLARCKEWHQNDITRWKALPDAKRPTLRYPRINYESRPSQSFNAMMNPILPYSIRGLLWYQGEMNSGAELYLKQYPFYAKNMREIFENPNMPIFWVQLPDYKESHWPKIRNVQRQLAEIVPHNGVAITIDGHEMDLHPRDKSKVVDRLARLALADVYGKKLVARAPVPQSVELKDGAVKIVFKHCAKGLKLLDGAEPRCFEIAGSDGKFFPAKAKLSSKDTVVLEVPQEVKEPKKSRYAWAADPDVNLYNSGDLPASPFEEDIK